MLESNKNNLDNHKLTSNILNDEISLLTNNTNVEKENKPENIELNKALANMRKESLKNKSFKETLLNNNLECSDIKLSNNINQNNVIVSNIYTSDLSANNNTLNILENKQKINKSIENLTKNLANPLTYNNNVKETDEQQAHQLLNSTDQSNNKNINKKDIDCFYNNLYIENEKDCIVKSDFNLINVEKSCNKSSLYVKKTNTKSIDFNKYVSKKNKNNINAINTVENAPRKTLILDEKLGVNEILKDNNNLLSDEMLDYNKKESLLHNGHLFINNNFNNINNNIKVITKNKKNDINYVNNKMLMGKKNEFNKTFNNKNKSLNISKNNSFDFNADFNNTKVKQQKNKISSNIGSVIKDKNTNKDKNLSTIDNSISLKQTQNKNKNKTKLSNTKQVKASLISTKKKDIESPNKLKCVTNRTTANKEWNKKDIKSCINSSRTNAYNKLDETKEVNTKLNSNIVPIYNKKQVSNNNIKKNDKNTIEDKSNDFKNEKKLNKNLSENVHNILGNNHYLVILEEIQDIFGDDLSNFDEELFFSNLNEESTKNLIKSLIMIGITYKNRISKMQQKPKLNSVDFNNNSSLNNYNRNNSSSIKNKNLTKSGIKNNNVKISETYRDISNISNNINNIERELNSSLITNSNKKTSGISKLEKENNLNKSEITKLKNKLKAKEDELQLTKKELSELTNNLKSCKIIM